MKVGPYNIKPGADLSGVDLAQANLKGVSLAQADLSEADLNNSNLIEADLSKATLRRTNLIRADLSKATLREANLIGAKLFRAILTEADLSEADLTNTDLTGAKLFGANLFNVNLSKAILSEANLRGTNLTKANLSEADLSEADLTIANLHKAILRGANLAEANLTKANLSEADLRGANLRGAILNETCLEGANLTGADLNETAPSEADLAGAVIDNTAQASIYEAEYLRLKHFSHQCWNEIKEKRKYQVPSDGRAEIMASDELNELINLESVRFVQKGIEVPGVILQFQFGGTPDPSIVKINPDGSIEGFHKSSSDKLREALIEAIALSYYRDLVTPGKTYYYIPGGGTPKTKSTASQWFRRLPRPQGVPLKSILGKQEPPQKVYHDLSNWHSVQEHFVIGHERWVSEGFRASSEKQQQALKFIGRNLRPGFTWVREHKRGISNSDGLRHRNGYLVERTVFLPPERASQELKEMKVSKLYTLINMEN